MMTALLMSGGIDSTALAAWKRPDMCITIDYGQLAAEAEIYSAGQICSDLNLTHEVLKANCSSLGSGDMSGTPAVAGAPIPEWWPFRNQLLVTLAAIRCASLDVRHILVGAVKEDASHKDGVEEFFKLLDSLTSFQELYIRVSAPAIRMSSVELVKASGISQSTLALTHSCHTGRLACGKCRGCRKHITIMDELQMT
jgi:7-cyano-7-deazaguanine synthase